MTRARRDERGQAFPVYVMTVAGLLFLALVFFAVGKASATRNGAQSAADAAALGAAQEARALMGPLFFAALALPDGLDGYFRGAHFTGDTCGEAQRLAGLNRSDVVAGSCSWDSGVRRDEVTVEVRTRYTVGDSVLPGTEQRHATAGATAAVEFRCDWQPAPGEPDGGAASGGPSGGTAGTSGGTGATGGANGGAGGTGGDTGSTEGGGERPDTPEAPGPVTFRCDGSDPFSLDPAQPFDPDVWAELGKELFGVRLVD
ncbi:pilus assembly protein TadG-related protein [Streptomyces sp. LP05-1]|uniref:Pilus assembly protein TadG-related protein n=1 Tax=Streptomyces pyxinae TaxID=2970734 RepID=A0ABT2CB20_9ACTN|nr:pilus assembly protein TadG-related protein [Streptomyces sp. LP05-1]MCS0634515.1 pilus assembly protein TadG-related protein [Streptomyces sp. LP05-1]